MSFFSWMFGGSNDEEHKINNHHQSATRTTSSLSVSVPTQQQQNQSIISSSSPQTQLAYMKRVLEAKEEQQQNQSQQQQQKSKLVNSINPLTTWRDESDPHFVPFCFGHFHKSHHRRVCLTEEAAEVERRQREADMMQCHCALNLVDAINCSSDSSNDQSSAITINYSTSPRSPSSAAAPKNPYQRIKDSIEKQGLLAGSPRLPACRIHDIMNALPIRFREIQWKMIFASDVDGYSLGSLYRRVESNGVTGACLLLAEVVESSSSSPSQSSSSAASPSVIGAFLSDPPSLNHGPHHFYGSPETFVFSFDDDANNDDNEPSAFNLSSASASFADSTTSSNLPTPKRGAAGGTTTMNDSNISNNQSRRARRESSSGIAHHHRHHRHHSFRKSKGKLRTHHYNDKDPSAPPEHFLVCSPNHMGIGGGEDGAAILFVNDLQKGTSTANCASFNHSPPLVGQPRHGLTHSEFKVFRLYLFALDSSSDFIEYLIKAANPTSSSPSSSSSQTRKSNNNNNNNPNSIFDKYPCKGCEIQPRNHHKCNFIHDEFEKKIHPPVSATSTTKGI